MMRRSPRSPVAAAATRLASADCFNQVCSMQRRHNDWGAASAGESDKITDTRARTETQALSQPKACTLGEMNNGTHLSSWE